MPLFTFDELPNSRTSTVSPPSETRRYIAKNSSDNVFVTAFAYGATPAVIASAAGMLYRQDIKASERGHLIYDIEVPYGPRQNQTGQWTWNYDTTGGSFNIKASKQTVNRYGAGAPDCKQLIGVNGDTVEGADIVIPALKINATYKHPLGVVTIPFAKHIARCTGKVNSDTFLTFDAGEVLFLGGTGSDGSQAETEAGYQFACEENLQDQIVGAITGIQKDGWDIAWIKWKDAEDGGLPAKQPQFVYVERVYTRISLSAALGFGG